MDQYSIEKINDLKAEYESYKEVLSSAILRQDWESVAGATFIMESIKEQIASFK
jgi:hypothetical protein